MGRKVKISVLIISIIFIFAIVVYWIYWGNTHLQLNTYTIKSERLPENFDGFRIAQVSDLHNAEIGESNKELLDVLRKSEPDIIAITGDLIDSRRTNIDVALNFVQQALEIAPCYYVTGNHEGRISAYDDLRVGLIDLGVNLLECEKVELKRGGDTISLIGVNDPGSKMYITVGDSESVMRTNLQNLVADDDGFTVLLSHRPELFDIYKSFDIDIVLSGHAHGGQFRLPFVGGLIAPNQGVFPKYDAGQFTEQNTNMIVSRGIGNSAFPFRFNNCPEVVLLELHSDDY